MIEETSAATPKAKTADESLLKVTVSAPYRTYFDDAAYSVTAENETGPFDILPQHHNFITLLDTCEIIIRTPDGDQKIKITQGLMHVKSDQVTVFLDI